MILNVHIAISIVHIAISNVHIAILNVHIAMSNTHIAISNIYSLLHCNDTRARDCRSIRINIVRLNVYN